MNIRNSVMLVLLGLPLSVIFAQTGAPASTPAAPPAVPAVALPSATSATLPAAAPKFFLNPDKFFCGFSMGSNFDLIDGFNNNTLYADIEVNTGSFGDVWNIQLGANRGRAKSLKNEQDATSYFRRLYAHPDIADSTLVDYIRATDKGEVDVITDRADIFARINWKAVEKAGLHLYLSLQFEYLSITQNVTHRFVYKDYDTLSEARFLSETAGVSRSIFSLRNDTTKMARRFDLFYPSFGFTIFKETSDVDFLLTNTFGLMNYNDGPMPGIENELGFTYIAKASILEKQAIGAKLGFEFRYSSSRYPNTEYFFFISKQFSMAEFFKLFKP